MQVKDFTSVDIKVYKNDILIYEGPVDYAENKIKDMVYKDVKPTGSDLIFYV